MTPRDGRLLKTAVNTGTGAVVALAVYLLVSGRLAGVLSGSLLLGLSASLFAARTRREYRTARIFAGPAFFTACIALACHILIRAACCLREVPLVSAETAAGSTSASVLSILARLSFGLAVSAGMLSIFETITGPAREERT
ncbi:MAG: hypothetical protein JW909_03030 [Planctomycetes bacterium]|nr:hypothetical protein [Planctomycetota bacterium]